MRPPSGGAPVRACLAVGPAHGVIRLDPSLRVGGAYRVEAVLLGRWAQLWNKSGTIFFEQ